MFYTSKILIVFILPEKMHNWNIFCKKGKWRVFFLLYLKKVSVQVSTELYSEFSEIAHSVIFCINS